MRDAPYASSYIQVIKQLPGARTSDKPFRIGNKNGRNVWVPLASILEPDASYEPGEEG